MLWERRLLNKNIVTETQTEFYWIPHVPSTRTWTTTKVHKNKNKKRHSSTHKQKMERKFVRHGQIQNSNWYPFNGLEVGEFHDDFVNSENKLHSKCWFCNANLDTLCYIICLQFPSSHHFLYCYVRIQASEATERSCNGPEEAGRVSKAAGSASEAAKRA